MDHSGRAHRYFAWMRCQQALMLLVVPVLFWTACRKDEDGEPPTVSITAPGAALTVVMPDTLRVVAEISDNERIESVTFSVLDAQGFPITAPFTVEPSSNPVTLTVDLPLTSDLVLSGEHEVKVVASDGTGRGTSSRLIDVVAIPRRLRAIYLLSQPVASEVAVHRIDSTGQLQAVSTIAQDLSTAAVSSRGQRLFLGGGFTGPLRAVLPDLGTTLAQVPGQNTLQAPYFTALHVGLTGLLFTATNDGQLRRYNKDLNGTGYLAGALANYRITAVLELENTVITAQAAIASADQRLVQYSPIGGAQTDIRVLDKVPVALLPRDADHILLFGNRNGEGVVEDRDITDGGYWEPRTFPAPIDAVVRLDANTYIVATGGDLVRFTYNNAGAITIATGVQVQELAYNQVSGELIVASGNTALIMDPMNGSLIDTYTLPQAVEHVLPLFNR